MCIRDSTGTGAVSSGKSDNIWKTVSYLKFRTMVNNADKIGTQVTTKGDSRVTRMGKMLSGCRLDELPQPVSYTHLDVYKRQIISAPFALAGPEFK